MTAAGAQTPLLLLLPGLDGTGALFGELQAALRAYGVESMAIAYPLQPSASHDALATDIAALIPHDRPIALLGESFGASVAVKLAASSRLSVTKLVLCAPAWRAPPAPARWLARRTLPWLMRRPLLDLGLRMFGMNGASGTARRRVAAVVAGCDWRILVARLDLLEGLDLPALASRLALPILLIRPSRDRLANVAAALGAQGQDVEIPGPHFILQAEPERSARVIADYLKS